MGKNKIISRRQFLKIMGGVFGSAISIPSAYSQTFKFKGPIKNIGALRQIHPPIRKFPIPHDLKPQGGDQVGTPRLEKKPFAPDDPPGFGPYIVMDHPDYYAQLYANRFFDQWKANTPNWFGAAQYQATRSPTASWLANAYKKPSMCAVSTIWNKGQQPAFGVIMRSLCFVMAEKGGKWEEVARQDLGYVCVGTIAPNDFVEVSYSAKAVSEGMKAVDQYLVEKDPNHEKWPEVWFFHKCFSFDPVSDPISLRFPIKTSRHPKCIIGGRHAGGWRWQLPRRNSGTPRVRYFS